MINCAGRTAFWIVLLLTAAACAQEFLVFFDPAGNFLVETAETLGPPQIRGQPQMQVVQPGATATFSVVALDTSGLSYQWLFNGTNIPAASNDALQITNVSTNNQGYYSVVLTNLSGSVTSSPAPLWIDSRGCGMPDWWQLYYFGNLNQNATADFDGDGVSNLQEFLDGTNPTNAASARYRLVIINYGTGVSQAPAQLSYTNGAVVMLTATALAPYSFRGWGGDLAGTNNPASVTMTTNRTVVAYGGAFTLNWTNASGGDWNAASNWSPNLVPDPSDNVLITTPVTVTSSNSVECASLSLGAYGVAPTLAITGNLTLDGPSYWLAGTMSGSGTTIVGAAATLTFANPGTAIYLSGRTLENDGFILWSGPSVTLSSAIISNAPGAVFVAENAANLTGSSSRFDNAGIFRKDATAGTTTVTAPFNNLGTVDIQSGTLLFGAFTNSGVVMVAPGATNQIAGGGFTTGSFNAPAAAMVVWTGVPGTPAFNLNSGAQLSGAGLYRLDGATVNFNTDLVVQNLQEAVTVGGTATTLNENAILTISNLMSWTDGSSMGGNGRLIIAPGAMLSAAANPYSLSLGTCTLENGGTVLWTGNGSFNFNTLVTNRAGALFDDQASASLGGSGARFDNAGTLRKSITAGTTSVYANLNNYATVDLEAGTLQFSSPSTNSGSIALAPGTTNLFSSYGLTTGTFTNPPGSLVEWNSSSGVPYAINPGAQLNGAGLYRLDAGYVSFNTDLPVQNLDVIGTINGSPTLSGTGNITLLGAMNWNFGTLGGGGKLLISPGAVMNVTASPYTITLDTRTLENGGTVTFTGTAGINCNNNAIITNRVGALFDAQTASSIGSSGSHFDNSGVFRKSVNTGTLTLYGNFTNYGTVDIRSGILTPNNTFASSSNALLNCGLGGTSPGSNYGQLQVSGTVTLNGGLSVNLLPGYVPATDDTFTVVSAGSRSNAFSSFTYPSNRVAMVLTNSPSAVILSITGVSPIPQPVLFTPQILGSNVLLTWSATSNVTYRLQNNGVLGSTNWAAVPGDVTTLSNTATKLDALTPSNRFYRVRVLP